MGGFSFDVPADYATYRLVVNTARNAPAVLGTRSTVAWTFGSGHSDPSSFARLPLWSVRLAPPVDATSSAPAGSTFIIPLSLSAPPGTSAGSIRSVSVAYSTNDGATWAAATVGGSGSSYTATLTHPATPGFVSLRVMASDWAGNSVEETLIRVYQVS